MEYKTFMRKNLQSCWIECHRVKGIGRIEVGRWFYEIIDQNKHHAKKALWRIYLKHMRADNDNTEHVLN